MKAKRHITHTGKRNRWEYLVMNLFVFAGIGVLSLLVFNISLFNPLILAFKDFTLTDLYYQKIQDRDHNKIYKGPLMIINVEKRSRTEIAYLLQKLETGKPRVIGFDIIFRDRGDSAEDLLLKSTIAQHSNMVFPYKAGFDKITEEEKTDDYFQVNSTSFVNLIGEKKENSTVRYYYPVYKNTLAFTTAIVQKYDPAIAAPLLKRDKEKTEIRYYGNIENFDYQTIDEIMDPGFDVNKLKDKILLLGYAGETPNAGKLDDDRFFTPLNEQLSGRSYPDMYGLVVNANILRMGLDKDFVYVLPRWLNWILAFCFSWALIPLFVRWYVHKAVWFHLFAMLMQLFFSILFVFFTIIMYAKANVKIQSSEVLVAVLLLIDFLMFYDHLVKFLKHKLKWNFHSKFFEGSGH